MLTRYKILNLLFEYKKLRPMEIQKKLGVTISNQIKTLRNHKFIKRINNNHKVTVYEITESGVDEVIKSTRIRILEELNVNSMQTPRNLKSKINSTVSPMLTRMRKDKQILRTFNQDNGNDIRYSITHKGLQDLNNYLEM